MFDPSFIRKEVAIYIDKELIEVRFPCQRNSWIRNSTHSVNPRITIVEFKYCHSYTIIGRT